MARSVRLALLALILHTSHFTPHTSAQRPPAQPNAAEILHKMQKLNVLGSVLYIVAHPDDENTRLIAWLANGKKVRTGNLSLTRGDGGQNLIGPELGDALGIIRTQELLEARRIDGGEQFFTRAVDFGYSKSAEESFQKWGKQEVLSDVVRVIRTFRPDIIITRFPPTREAGHGHHEASAILAEEAFKLAGDPKAFPEHLTQGLEVWQPRRLFFNGSTWWKKNLAEIAKPDSGWYTVDVGGYDPLLGLSYTEIAGRSRSMHKSQGFGAAETRGEMIEYLKLIAGDQPKGTDIFEGIDMTWKKAMTPASGSIRKHIEELIGGFDPMRPEASDSLLGVLFTEMGIYDHTTDPQNWLGLKHRNVSDLLQWCSGLNLEAVSSSPTIAVGDSAKCIVRGVLRRPVVVKPSTKRFLDLQGSWDAPPFRMNVAEEIQYATKATTEVDEPYWLKEPHQNLYASTEPRQIGSPVLAQQLVATLGCYFPGTRFNIPRNMAVEQRWVDRVAGERVRPVYVTTVASIEPRDKLKINGGDVVVEVRALTDKLTGKLEIENSSGFGYAPLSVDIGTMKKDERKTFTFKFTGNDKAVAGVLKFKLTSGVQVCTKTLHEIDYPHILPQVYYTPAEVKMIPLDVKTTAKTVGYIKGAGDEVPQAIEQLGVKVDIIDASAGSAGQLTLESLKKYDAIVTGIRAYNTTKELKDLNPVLMKYVEQGGTLVCQYNTKSSDMVLPDSLFGPYPFKLTRDRVTVEEATPTFLAPDHPLLNTPNKITAADFDGWVQERGLYFCGSLDKHYTPLIAWNDPGEQPLNGGLITCDHGQGRYIYTGISFFRELPAGVPGAYRLFANLISKRTP